ncbi:PAS domain S-box protein [Roseivirga sp. E12]|uniref:PAS domain-containing protein n=1 Tax=Roseivirga sp. E12 TaxID=2819237 RepID=UPI001ABD2630|nr:PAS domain S-box protein [Roseivirga sp. E12]MBO3699969.1 PAS domain S-box protein [Roseivirga sp. E12]
MENIFKDTLNDFADAKVRDMDLQSVVSNLSETVWSINLTNEPYEIHYHNDPLLEFGAVEGHEPSPHTFEDWQKLIHPEDRDRVLEEVVNALGSGAASYSYRIKRNGNGYKYFRDRVSVLFEEGKPIRLDGISIDIDSIRRSRLNLELSQQRLKSIVDALPDPVFISTKEEGKIIFANEILFKVYEMTPADFLGKKAVQFYENFEGRKSYVKHLRKDGHVQNHELLLKNKKGESFWVSASTMPLDFQNQDCFITILQDVTVRKNLEREIQESNARYQLAVEGTNDVIWEYDFKTKHSYLSPQFWAGMELEPVDNPLDDELVAKYLFEEEKEDFLKNLNEAFENQVGDMTLEIRFVASDERIIWVLFKARILYDHNGKPQRGVGSLSNITSLKEAQSQLKESEAKYKLISENSSDCICLQKVNGEFVFVSPSSTEVLGYSPDELRNINLREFIHEDYQQLLKQKIVEVVKGNERTASIVYKAYSKGAKPEWLETIAGAIFDDQTGRAIYVQTSTRNVTDRIEAQTKLKESQERYKLITENSNDIVSLMDPTGKYLFLSPSIKDKMGYEPEELIGRNTLEFIHPDDQELVANIIGEVVEAKRKEDSVIFRIRHKSGEWRWIKATGGVILDDDDNVIYIRSNKTDITESKLTEDKLKQQEEQYKLVSENSGDVIALHDLHGQLTFVSPSCYRMLGLTVEETMAIKDFVGLVHPDEREKIKHAFIDTIKNTRKDTISSVRLKRAEGEYLWVGVSLSAVLDENGRTKFVQTSTRDISEIMKVIEKERQLNKLKSSFISMASHEFRTPLTTIQSSNELISMYLDSTREPVDTKLSKHVLRIRTELERLNSLLKDVFTLGRLDVGKARLNKDITSLSGIVKQVVLENSVSFKERAVSIHTEGDERQVKLDSQLISHVLSNLINNALKYSQGGKDPQVTMRYEPGHIELQVQDFGIGIPKKDQEGLFESFSRASNVGDIEGTGLGLVIVKQFVEMHGGTISYESKVNKGTIFTVVIPDLN